MPADPEADQIRLTVPGTAAMATVVQVAARFLGDRADLSDAEADAARVALGAAFTALVEEGDQGAVELLAHVAPRRLVLVLTGTAGSRTIEAPG